jgi:hypothetical protein
MYLIQVFCRYLIGIAFIAYAMTKVVGTQLTGEPSVYGTPMSLLSGFELTWAYYGWLGYYRILIAVAELVAAVLLFFRPTARIGYVMALGILGPIVPMDLAYGVGQGTVAAIVLFIAALVLLVLDRHHVIQFLFAPYIPNRAIPSRIRRLRPVKWVVVPASLVGISVLFILVANQTARVTELQGTWQFRTADGPTHLFVDRGPRCFVRFDTRTFVRPTFGSCTVDEAENRLAMEVSADASLTGEAFGFVGTYTVSDDGRVLTLSPDDGTADLVLDAVPERRRTTVDDDRTVELLEQEQQAVPASP